MSAILKKTRKRGGANLRCPVCGALTRVMDTRRRERGVLRARACTRCSKGFMTLERIHVEVKREG